MNVFVADWNEFLLLRDVKGLFELYETFFHMHVLSVTTQGIYCPIFFTTYIPNAFILSFPHRNHQCGLQLVIWQVTYSTPPSLSCPLSPSFPSTPLPLSRVNLLPDPPFPLHQDSPCLSRNTASPCPWVWRSTASPSSTWSRWGRNSIPTKILRTRMSSQRGDTLRFFLKVRLQCAQLWNDWSTVSDAAGVWNKEGLCADRLSYINSLKQTLSTRQRLYGYIHEEGGGSLLSLWTDAHCILPQWRWTYCFVCVRKFNLSNQAFSWRLRVCVRALWSTPLSSKGWFIQL